MNDKESTKKELEQEKVKISDKNKKTKTKSPVSELWDEFKDDQYVKEGEPSVEPDTEPVPPKPEPKPKPEPTKAEEPAEAEKEPAKEAVITFTCPDCLTTFDNAKSLRGHCSATGHTYPEGE